MAIADRLTLRDSPQERSGQKASIWSRQQTLLVGVLIVVSGMIYLTGLRTFQIGTYSDDAHYITAARALVSGRGFVLASILGAPPETRFPPGFPIILAPIAFIFPNSLDVFRVPSLLFTLASLPLWIVYLRRFVGFGQAYLIVSAAAINPLVVGHARIVMSEAPFLFFFALLLVVCDEERASRWSWISLGLALGGLGLVLFFLRTAGIAIFAAVVLYLIIQRRPKTTVLAVAAFSLPALVWILHNYLIARSAGLSTYQGQFLAGSSDEGGLSSASSAITRVLFNATHYPVDGLPDAFALGLKGARLDSGLMQAHLLWMPAAIGVVLTGLVLIGFVSRARAHLGVGELSCGLYGLVLLLWPWELSRFLHPLLPILYFYLFAGLVACLRVRRLLRLPRVANTTLAATVIGVLMVLNVFRDVQDVRNPVRSRITDLQVGSEWIMRFTSASSVVMSPNPLERSLYTRRLMTEIPSDLSSSDKDYLAAMKSLGVSYVLLAPPLQDPRTFTLDDATRRMQAVVSRHPESFQLTYSDPANNIWIYAVKR